MSQYSDGLRLRYLSDVTGSMSEYVERGGGLRFLSDRSGAGPLEITFELDDPDLYSAILLKRMARRLEPQEHLLA